MELSHIFGHLVVALQTIKKVKTNGKHVLRTRKVLTILLGNDLNLFL